MKKFVLLFICAILLVAALLIPTFGQDKTPIAGKGEGTDQSVRDLATFGDTLAAMSGLDVAEQDGAEIECQSMTVQLSTEGKTSLVTKLDGKTAKTTVDLKAEGVLYMTKEGYCETLKGYLYQSSTGSNTYRSSFFFDMDLFVTQEMVAIRLRRYDLDTVYNDEYANGSSTLRLNALAYDQWVALEDLELIEEGLGGQDLFDVAADQMQANVAFLRSIAQKDLDFSKTYTATKEEVQAYFDETVNLGLYAETLQTEGVEGSVTVDLWNAKAPKIQSTLSFGGSVKEGSQELTMSVYNKTDSTYTHLGNTVLNSITLSEIEGEDLLVANEIYRDKNAAPTDEDDEQDDETHEQDVPDDD